MIGPLPGETVKSASYTYKDFVIIDTPGLNDVDKENSKKVNKELKTYDNVILFLNAAGTVLSKNELDLYNKLIKSKTNVLIVINKIDKETSIDYVIHFVRKNTGDKAQDIKISTKTSKNIINKNEIDLYNKLIKSKTNVLIVINKIDKATSIDSVIRFVRQNTGDKAQVIAISTKTGENIDQLEEAMLNFIS